MPIDQDIRDVIIESLNESFDSKLQLEKVKDIEEEIHNLFGNDTPNYIKRQKELVAFFRGDSKSVIDKIVNGDYTPVQIAKTDFIEFKFPKKSKVDYKGLQNIDIQVSGKAVRDSVVIKLKNLYKNILDIPLNQVPITPIKDIEDALFNRFGSDPQEYMIALTRILVFGNPKDYIGQYATSFREKLLQGVYAPERLVELDMTELLPEVFLNPESSQATLLEIHDAIDKAVIDATADTVADINVMIDPTGKRTKIPVRDLSKLKKQIGKHQVDTHKICGNPYWDMKKVNTIICKQDQKFYCLDIEELLVQLAKGEKAKNYFTGKELSQEINDNLQKVYGKEIKEISNNGGKKVSVGSRTLSELETLKKTLNHLEYLADLMKDQDTIDAVAVFGLEFFEDNTELNRKDAIESIPVLTRQEFDAIIENDPEKGAIEFRDWLNDNIATIKKILDQPVEESPDVESIEIIQTADFTSGDRNREAAFVKKEILRTGSMSKFIVDDYLSRLDDANKIARDQLQRIVDVEKRQKVNENISEINKTIKDIKEYTKTIGGVINLLESHLKGLQNQLADSSTGRKELLGNIENIEKEIEYVKEMQNAFMST